MGHLFVLSPARSVTPFAQAHNQPKATNNNDCYIPINNTMNNNDNTGSKAELTQLFASFSLNEEGYLRDNLVFGGQRVERYTNGLT